MKAVQRNRIIPGDCLEAMTDLPDGCADMILTDPPYYRVVKNAWDRQWKTPGAFIAWLGAVADEWRRVLAPNGSLYCFASPQMAASVERMLAERFTVLNHIVWVKPGGRSQKACKAVLRGFFPTTERIIFCEQKGAGGEALWNRTCDALRGEVFTPLRAYFGREFAALGWGADELNRICETASMAGRHYVAASQWCCPTAEHYAKLQAAAGGKGLSRAYADIRREHDELAEEYHQRRAAIENRRRAFSVTPDVPYTDVWNFPTVAPYPGKHPCEKPQALLRHIIEASTKPGALVLDTFAGSGATCEAAYNLGRDFIVIEKNQYWVGRSRARVAEKCQTPLFGEPSTARATA